MAKGAATTTGGAAKKAPAKKTTTAKRPRKKAGSKASKSKAVAITAHAIPSAAVVSSSSSAAVVPDRGPLPTLILDSGGWTVKHGTVLPSASTVAAAPGNNGTPSIAPTFEKQSPRLSPNATAKPHHQLTILCADQISQISNQGQLSFTRPLERGYPTDLTAQLRVWKRICDLEGILAQPLNAEDVADLSAVWAATTMGGGKKRGGGSSRAATPAMGGNAVEVPAPTLSSMNCQVLLLTQPFTPRSISDRVDEVLFRDLGFVRVGKILGQCAASARYVDPEGRKELRLVKGGGSSAGEEAQVFPIDDETECCLVVDSGFSLTHVVPTYQCQAVSKAIRRLNIGGRTITNLLKEWVSYRQWNMMDETALVNEAKEALCYVLPSSRQYDAEMAEARKMKVGYRDYDREFVLPDFAETFTGSVRLASGLRKRLDQKEREKERRERKELKKRQKQKGKEETERKEKADGKKSKGDENAKHSKKNKGGKRKLNSKDSNKEDDGDTNGNAEENDDEVDSDEETDEQRLKRIQRMKEEERRRRELEEESRQALALSVERFAAPEILFRPDDVGLDQGGIAETIVQSVEACPDYLRAAMYQNVLITGGNARIPGFVQRLENELRSLAPSQYMVRVYVPQDPVAFAWKGAARIVLQSVPTYKDTFQGAQKMSQQVSILAGRTGSNPPAKDNLDAFRKCFVDRIQWEAGASSDNGTEDDMIVM